MTGDPQPTEAQELAALLQHFADLATPAGAERTIDITITGPDGLTLEVDITDGVSAWLRAMLDGELGSLRRGLDGTAEDDPSADDWP